MTSAEIEKLRQDAVDLQTEIKGFSTQMEDETIKQDATKLLEISTQLDERIVKFDAINAQIKQAQDVARITSNDGVTAATTQLATQLTGTDDSNTAAILAQKEHFGMKVLFGRADPKQLSRWEDRNKDKMDLITQVQKRQAEQLADNITMFGLDTSISEIVQAMSTSGPNAGMTTVPSLVFSEMESQLAHYNQLRKVARILPLTSMADVALNVLSATASGAGVGSADLTNENARQAGSQDLHIQAPELKRQRISVKELVISHDLLGSNAVVNFVDMLLEELAQEIGIQESNLMFTGTANIKGLAVAIPEGSATTLGAKTLATTITKFGGALGVMSNVYRRGAAIFMHDEVAQAYLTVSVGTADTRIPGRLLANPDDPTEYRTGEGWRVLTDNSLEGLAASGDLTANKRTWTVLGRNGYAIGEYVNAPVEVGLFQELDHFQKSQIVVSARRYVAGTPWNPAAYGSWKTSA